MKRILDRLFHSVASLWGGTALVLLLFAAAQASAQSGNFCNNAVPPCNPKDVTSPCYTPPPPDEVCQPKECKKCTKSPCYVGSGVYTADVTDLSIRTTGFSIDAQRLYESSHHIDSDVGYGWVSGLSARLYYAVYLKSPPSTYQKEAEIRLPDGRIQRFVDNGNGTFTGPDGRFDTLVQNGDGTWDFWVQRSRSRYHFNAVGQLEQMIDDYGNALTWTYVNDRLSHIADSSGSGRSIDVTYGADGRISDVTDMTGRDVHYVYNASGLLTSATNAAGQATTYSYIAGKYNPLLNGITDPWGRSLTTIVYDAQDRVRSYTEAGETFTYTYNYNNIATQTSKSDSNGNVWVFPFGTGGLVTESRPPGGGAAVADTYTSAGLPQLHTDAAGVKTYTTYNARGQRATVTNDYQGTSAVEWRYVYDTNFPDQLASQKAYNPSTGLIHPNWQGQRFEYYPAGSPAPGALYRVYALESDGTTSILRRELTYDAKGHVTRMLDALGNATDITYDAAGNRISETRPANNDAGTRPVTTYGYDSLGRISSITDANGNVTTYTYDVLDRITIMTLPKPTPSSTLTFTMTTYYDEFDAATQLLFERVVDVNGNTTKRGRDAWGQLLRTVDGAGNVTRFVYTKGLLTERIDANNYSVTFVYDARRRRTTTNYPDGTNELITYNADDTVASKRDRAGQTVTYTYDRFKRIATKTYPNGGVITSTFQGQKLTQVSDTFTSPPETHTFTYDSAFRATSNTQGARGTISRTYDAASREATVTVAGGPTTTYGYYPDGSLRTIVWSLASGTFKYDYTLDGKISLITMPNGQTRAYAYDDQGRTTQVLNVHPTAGPLATFAYGYDVNPFTSLPNQLGRRTTVTATIPELALTNAVTQYAYDARDQLSQASYPAAAPYNGLTQSWTYDALSNRTSATDNGTAANYVYTKLGANPLNTVRLQSDGANAFTYDAKGNVTARSGSRGNFTFTSDYEDRLRSVGGDQTAGYLYDYVGRRGLKTVAGVGTTYLFDGVQFVAENGAATVNYLFGPGVDAALAVSSGGQVYYYSVDVLGSVWIASDSSGSVENWYAWDAFGTARGQKEGIVSSIGFTAREQAEAGLRYYRMRSYEPAVGRFASEDPTGFDAGPNVYRYADNQPTMLIDPMGLFTVDPSCRCQLGKKPYDLLVQQTKEWCANLWRITDDGLRKCLDRRCRHNGRIECEDDCSLGETGMDGLMGYNRFFPNTAHVCTNTGSPWDEWGNTVIHEWAHSCWWFHGGGKGVPE